MHTFILFNNTRWGGTVMILLVKRRYLGIKKVLDSQFNMWLPLQFVTSCKLSNISEPQFPFL